MKEKTAHGLPDELKRIKKENNAIQSSLKKEIAELKKENSLLHECTANYRAVFNSIGDGVVTTDGQGNIKDLNPAAENMCGWARSEVLGKSLADVFHMVDASTGNTIISPVQKVMESGRVEMIADETLLISRKGKKSRIMDCAAPVKNEQGETTGVILVFSDATEKYATEVELKESKDRFWAFLNAIEDMIFLKDDQRRYLFANDATAKFFGTTQEAMIGKTDKELAEKRKIAPCESSDKRALEATSSFIVDELLGNRYCETKKFPVMLNDNRKGIGGIIRDISKRKQLETELREREEKYRRLFETMSQGVIYQSAGGEIFSANPSAEHILGLSFDQMKGRSSEDPRWDMITEEGEKVPGDQHPAMTAMRTGKITGPVVRGVFVPERNEYVWLSITATPLFHPGEDKAFQVYSIFDDITVFKKHQDKIKEQQLINTIIERLPIGIALNSVKPQVRFEVINDNFARFYGVSKETLLQPDMFWDAVYEDETFREEMRNRVLSDMESGDPEKMKWHDIPITKEGHIVNYVSAQNIPLKDSDLVISTVWDVTDQKQAKQALKDSETKYRTLFETANDAIIIMDAETIIECNKRTEELYGRTKEQIIGRRPWELSPELQPDGSDSEKTALDKIRTVLQGEKQFFEWRHVRGNGSLFDVEVSLNDYSINDKPYIQAIIRDITARKKAEAETLRAKRRAEENEVRFKTLFDKSPLSIYIHDKDTGDIVDANEQAYSSYGFANVEELRRHDIWLQPPYSVKEAKQWINKTVQEGAQQFEWKNKHISGEIFWELVTLRPIKINGVERILAAAIDITDKKHKEIKEEVLYNIANATFLTNDIKELTLIIKKQLSKLIDTTNFYIALYDKNSGCLSAPYESDEKDQIDIWPAKGSMTGLVVEKKKTFLVKKPEILKLISKGVIDQIGNMCEVWLGVPLLIGEDVIGAVVVQDYHNPDEYDRGSREILEFISYQISLALQRQNTINDLVKAKEKAQESDRLKSAFLANMSHEIRTPMNGILGFAELLKDSRLSEEQERKYIEMIEQSGVRMLNIINNLVDISKIESGVVEVIQSKVNVNEQLDYIYNFFKPQTEEKGMKLVLSSSLPPVQSIIITDREKLIAILTNLVKNAVKYSREGIIDFGCRKSGRILEFFVSDTGRGIPEDRQHAIFDRFVQADIEDRDALQGAGLGLAISKAYVEILGGGIRVESQPGQGSTFYFTLPYKTK